MAINFPTATSVGQTFIDPGSGTIYVCTRVGPPATWSASGGTSPIVGRSKRELGTPVTSTSGTAITFSNVPSWATRVTLTFDQVSLGGTTSTNYLIQLGDSGGFETTGYDTGSALTVNSASKTNTTLSSGFILLTEDRTTTPIFTTNSLILSGTIIFTLASRTSNTWVCSGLVGHSGSAGAFTLTGRKSLSSTLTSIRVTTVAGTVPFDSGSMNLYVEG